MYSLICPLKVMIPRWDWLFDWLINRYLSWLFSMSTLTCFRALLTKSPCSHRNREQLDCQTRCVWLTGSHLAVPGEEMEAEPRSLLIGRIFSWCSVVCHVPLLIMHSNSKRHWLCNSRYVPVHVWLMAQRKCWPLNMLLYCISNIVCYNALKYFHDLWGHCALKVKYFNV